MRKMLLNAVLAFSYHEVTSVTLLIYTGPAKLEREEAQTCWRTKMYFPVQAEVTGYPILLYLGPADASEVQKRRSVLGKVTLARC